MNLIFFQNCVSPHQIPYMKVLAQRHHVTLVSPCVTLAERSALGWSDQTSKVEDIELLLEPNDEQVKSLMEDSLKQDDQTVCLFSGISGFKEVKHWLDMSLDYPVRRGIICEAPITYKWPLWLHKIKFVIRDLKYRKHIQYVFAIGEECADYYRSWGSHWQVVDFAYCVENAVLDNQLVEAKLAELSGSFNICFVGSLTRRKNVKVVLDAIRKLRHHHLDTFRILHLTLVGDGPERKSLERYVERNNMESQVVFAGTMPMEEVRQFIAYQDVLILPSIYDGWGAVVNEALGVGTQVWCSDRCGAKGLIGDESPLGKVFKPHDSQGLMQIIWNNHGFFLEPEHANIRRAKIRQWAQENISPEAMASIMEETLLPRTKSNN